MAVSLCLCVAERPTFSYYRSPIPFLLLLLTFVRSCTLFTWIAIEDHLIYCSLLILVNMNWMRNRMSYYCSSPIPVLQLVQTIPLSTWLIDSGYFVSSIDCCKHEWDGFCEVFFKDSCVLGWERTELISYSIVSQKSLTVPRCSYTVCFLLCFLRVLYAQLIN